MHARIGGMMNYGDIMTLENPESIDFG